MISSCYGIALIFEPNFANNISRGIAILVPMMANNIFSVAVLGFSNIERALVSSVCKLSQARTRRVAGRGYAGYQIVEPDKAHKIDILLVDGDDTKALEFSNKIRRRNSTIPVIMVSKIQQDQTHSDELALTRNRIGGLLLKSLDQVLEKLILNNATIEAHEKKSAKRCLIVDDSQLVRAQMDLLLQGFQLNIYFAEDAEAALKMVKLRSFDIIFLDVMLPEMDGYQACKLLKSDPNTNATPVVMLTSKKSPFNRIQGTLVGCDKYLTKPIDADAIHQVLKQFGMIQASPAATKSQILPN